MFASSGNRTRAARVAGEHSTTEPTMLCKQLYIYENVWKVLLIMPWEYIIVGEASGLISEKQSKM